MKKYNFNAGPSILPEEVIKQTAEAVLDFQGEGLSILEISHRAKYFQPVVDEAEALMKELLGVPEGYRVIFLGGVNAIASSEPAALMLVSFFALAGFTIRSSGRQCSPMTCPA